MENQGTITEADILSDIVEPDRPGLPKEVAQTIVRLRFHDRALMRMNELAEKNRRGELTGTEQADLDKYLRVGNFLNLLKAKALVSLSETSHGP
ncbi:MAG: hypothetical protein U0793_03670 [Gemmataceae bacterium]